MADLHVLISAGASPAAHNIIQHLKNLGCRVCAIDANEKALPLAAAVADQAVLSPLAGDPAYIPFIRKKIEESDLFIPFIDEEIDRLLCHGDPVLWDKCLLPPMETTRECLYKTRFQSFCKAHGLPVARETQQPPAVFKPDLGRGGKGVVFVDNTEDFECLSRSNGVVQEWIAGEEFTVDALFSKQGDLIRMSARQRDAAAGVSTIGTIADPEPFEPLVQEIARALKFSYLINLQVIRDSTGRLHIIEINPRIAGSIMFTVLSGLDFLKGAIDIYQGRPPELRDQQQRIRVIRYWSEHVEAL